MRTWLIVAAMIAVLGGLVVAQESDLAAEIAFLRQGVAGARDLGEHLAAERASLLEGSRHRDGDLETMVASLRDEPTEVLSRADPIRLFGDFRVRLGYTRDRDFGNQDNGIAPPLMALLGQGGGQTEDDEGHFLLGHFLIGVDFQLSRRVMTRFSIQAEGLFHDDDSPASARRSGAAAGGPMPGPTALATGLLGGGFDFVLTDIRLYEAFIQFDDVFDIAGLDVRSGRQEIVLGNEFIFGNNDFFSGETFDALRVTLELGDLTIDAIVAKLDVAETIMPAGHPNPVFGRDDGFDDDELYGLYLSWRPDPDLEVDAYWLYWNGNGGGSVGTLGNAIPSLSTGDALEETGFLRGFFHMLGLRLAGDFAAFDYNVEFAWQTGSLDDFLGRDVNGAAVEIDLGLTLDADIRARVYVRGLFSEGAHGDESGFIPLFPERHSYRDAANPRSGARYGLMDIIPMDNVFCAQVGAAFDPAADWTLGACVIWATHDADLRPFAAKEDDIGWELDLFADYRHSDEMTVGFGFGLFLPDEGAPFIGGSFIGPDGRDEPTFLGYVDLRVVF